MKCYRKNGSDLPFTHPPFINQLPSMKCYRKNGSDRIEPLIGHVEPVPQ